jgi:hypothetical protein
MRFRLLLASLVVSSLALAGCAQTAATTTHDPAGATDAGACACTVGDSGIGEVSVACYCGAHGCTDYATTLAGYCAHSYYQYVTVTTYTGCDVEEVDYTLGASGGSELFVASTGEPLGFTYSDDIPDLTCGTSDAAFSAIAVGTTELPSSCSHGVARPACPDAGAEAQDAAAASDAPAD